MWRPKGGIIGEERRGRRGRRITCSCLPIVPSPHFCFYRLRAVLMHTVAFHWRTWHVATACSLPSSSACACVCVGMLTLAAVKTGSVHPFMRAGDGKLARGLASCFSRLARLFRLVGALTRSAQAAGRRAGRGRADAPRGVGAGVRGHDTELLGLPLLEVRGLWGRQAAMPAASCGAVTAKRKKVPGETGRGGNST